MLHASKYSKKMQGCDMFGTPITVNYRGSEHHSTILSSIVSIAVIILIVTNFILLTIGYLNGFKYEAKSTSIQINGFDSKKFYLSENSFKVAAFYLFDDRVMETTKKEQIAKLMNQYEWVAFQKEPCSGDVHIAECDKLKIIGAFGECSDEEREEISIFQSQAAAGNVAKMASSHAFCLDHAEAYIAGEF